MNRTETKFEKVLIDRKNCKKCGRCVLAYPEYFTFDENFSVVTKKSVNDEKVIKICPHGAIIKR